MVLCGVLGPDLSPGTPRHFAWQAWHLVTFTIVSRGRRGTQLTSTLVSRGRRGTHGTVWRAWPGFVARGAAAFCAAGVALGDIHLRFTWQAWHSWYCVACVVLCGVLGPDLSFHVAGVALMVLCGVLGPDLSPGAPRHFAWQAWRLVTFTIVSRGRRGTQLTSTVVLRGRRGTHGTAWRAWPGFVARGAAAFCVAGVALGDIHPHFTWQAWHSWYCAARLARICRPGRRDILRGRRGTW